MPGSTSRRTERRFLPSHGLVAGCLTLLLAGAGGLRAQAPDTLARAPYTVEYWPQQAGLAERLLDVAGRQRPLPGLPAEALPGGPVRIVLAPAAAAWDSITGGAVPDWAAGIAVPEQGLVVMPTYSWERMSAPALYATLRHELAHVALGRWVQPSRVPRWFDEGYARWAAGEWGYDAIWQLRLAFFLRRAPRLSSLSLDWPRGASDARVAYLLSTSAVAHLARLGGDRGLQVLLRHWRETGSFDDALRRTLGMTPGQFEDSWIDSVETRYAWPVFLTHSVVFWALASILLVALFYIRRRRDRARLERLRVTDPPDEPAYWAEVEGPRYAGQDGSGAGSTPEAPDGEGARRGGGEGA